MCFIIETNNQLYKLVNIMQKQIFYKILIRQFAYLFVSLFGLLFVVSDTFAQTYEFSLVQRRRYDQIAVEIWAKRLSDSAPKIGGSSIVLQYNSQFLVPSAEQVRFKTDSINANINQLSPIDEITSPFNLAVNGFDVLESQSYSAGYYSLELKQKTLGAGGFIPSKDGKGTFVGKLTFNIIGNPSDNSLTKIDFSRSTMPGDLRVFDFQGNDIESNCLFNTQSNFTVLGITVLSPSQKGQVVDRDFDYASLIGDYAGGGYPIYFERSINPANFNTPVDEDLAYIFEYSLDNGNIWNNIGRVAESGSPSSSTGSNSKLRSGEIFSANKGTAYLISSQIGTKLDASNFRDPVRTIWAKNPYFTERSEQARLRITRLAGYNNIDILSRDKDNTFGVSKAAFVLGRLFFLQLNGNSEYIKSPSNVSNSTQLTVEAWINVNELKPSGSETGIVASSAGSQATPILGSTEGAWMLFLKDGRIPAFRVREIQGRGTNGYIGTVKANYLDSVVAVSSASPLSTEHSKNWVHLAATINNNTMALYMNGELVDKLVNNQFTDIRMLTTTHPVWVGVNPNGTIEQSDYLNAGIKGVKLWKIALSQDEIRQRAAGVADPANVSTYGDLRRGLQLYYSLEGTFNDLATDVLYQFGAEHGNFYSSGTISNASAYFRPDQPHIRLTTPTAGVGISNKDGATSEIRWISYGLGNIAKAGTKDVDIEYSIDGGVNWFYARDIAGKTLGGATGTVDVEAGTAIWSMRNDTPSPNIKTINPFARPAVMRIRGTEANAQTDLFDLSGSFTIAPNFSIYKSEATMIALAENSGMNIIGNTSFIEAWVRPYRFPTVQEGIFPIITKIDSTTNKFHYDLGIMPDGKLRFRVMDNKDSIRTAISSLSLVRPNSIAMDTAWSHVGVYLFLNSGTGNSEVRFYIDGFADRDTTASTGLGAAVKLVPSNSYPVYLGYMPSKSTKATGNITAGGSQTRNLNLVGNIYAAIATDTSLNISSPIYDKNGNAHTLNIRLHKTATAKLFTYSTQIDNNSTPWITPLIKISGNLDATANAGTTSTVIANVYDTTSSVYPFNLEFTKSNTSGLYNLQIKFGTATLYNNQVLFNNDGSLRSPMRIELSAFDLNNAIAKAAPNDVVFDTTKPQNLTIELANYDALSSGLTNYSVTSTLSAIDQKREIRFNEDGSLKSPEAINIESYYLNKALNSNVFDAVSPKDITLNLNNRFSNQSLSYYNSPSTVALSGQDGIATKTINGEVITTSDTSRGFVGELREIRFWNGTPNNTSAVAAQEPTPMTLFIQGAQAVRGNDLTVANSANLHSMYSFNGGTYVMNGWHRSSGMNVGTNAVARYFGQPIKYMPTEPYFKLVEPAFKQNVANMATDVRVRWVGFNYDGDGFNSGTPTKAPSLEFSIRGGGGQLIQPYQYVGCDFWKGNTKDAITIPNNNKFKFNGTGTDIIYALNLDASIADPDENNDGGMKQGPLSASLTNARFRLSGQYSIFTQTNPLQTEGPLFSITPASNFTVRAILEGHHDGGSAGKLMTNIGTTFANGGVRIKLFRDIGTVGDLVATQESSMAYDILDPVNKNASNYRFANINYIFTDLTDGDYWVLVEHINHLPVMSRFPATFKFTGDDRATWRIESGWDFISWNGVDDNVLLNPLSDPTPTGLFSAYGYAKRTSTDVNYSVTGLVFNDGRSGGNTKPLSAMIGGDVNQDWQINAADRVKVRLDDGTGLIQSDVTGDGYVNADDRTITDRNFGRVASVYNVTFPAVSAKTNATSSNNPLEYISELDEDLSKFFVTNAAKANQISVTAKSDKEDNIQAGLSYDVMAEANLKDNKVELRFYIQNKGGVFGLANCTFPVKYNSSVLEFAGLSGKDSVIFSNKSEVGYASVRTAPTADAINPIPEVRTIEIDYDAFANLGGTAVPYEKTYIGSLNFNLKTKNGAVTFTWHDSKSVHTTDRRLATPMGNFININPIMLYSAGLINPNGGEKLSQGRKQNITWNTNGDAMVFIEFSPDKGITWQKINSTAINVNTKSLEWTTPEYSSSNCLMRIIDSETGYEVDRSNDVFSIMPAFAQIIRPSSADPVYTGGKTDFIRWSAQGLDKVRFEFSSDGGTTWTSVSSSINSTEISSGWQLPKVTTKTAQIRMIDTENGKEIAKTGFFKILTGNFTFKSPAAKEKLLANRDTRVRWTSSDVSEFDMYLSLNGGYNWQLIRSDLAAQISYHNWMIPDTSSDKCIIRAIWNGDPEMEYARTGMFTIISTTSVEDDLPAGIEFSAVSPNPAVGPISIAYKSDKFFTANAEIISYSGETIKQLGTIAVSPGEFRYEADLSGIPSGKYLLVFKSDIFILAREVIISR